MPPETKNRAENPPAAVECYDVEHRTRIVVDVQPDKIHPGHYFTDGLRQAIAKYNHWDGGDPSAIMIYQRHSGGTAGAVVADGQLPMTTEGAMIRSFVFRLPSLAPPSFGSKQGTPPGAQPTFVASPDGSRSSTGPEALAKALERLTRAETTTFKQQLVQPATTLLARGEASAEVVNYIAACQKCEDSVVQSGSGKFSLLGAAGFKGIGKTQLLVNMCAGALGNCPEHCKFLYISYNGGGKAGAYCTARERFSHAYFTSISRSGHLTSATQGSPSPCRHLSWFGKPLR